VHAVLVGLGAGSTLALAVVIVAARSIWAIAVSAVALLSKDPDRRRTALEVLRLTGRRGDKTKSYMSPPTKD